MERRMKGIVFAEKGKVVVLEDLASPKLETGDVMIRTRVSGVTAGTELNFLTGGCYAQPWPILPGYQNVGEVIEISAKDGPLEIGQRVYSHYWYRPVRFAYRGKEYTRDAGAHLELRCGPPIHANLIPLPEDISDEEASLLSAVSIGMHGARRSGASIGKKVLVLGLGMIGQFAAQSARALGACCHGLDISRFRLEMAKEFACEKVFDGNADDVWEQIQNESPYDIIIETTGVNAFLDRALECLAGERNEEREMMRQGVLYLMGGREKIEYTNMLAHPKEAILMHSSHHTRKEVHEALRLRRLGIINIAPLITHRFSPDEAPNVYQRLLEGDPDMLGVVFKWI
jgi:2-desacetyl-2-hydroxyethyl bacteriochlorophyllide A dehydrogenase